MKSVNLIMLSQKDGTNVTKNNLISKLKNHCNNFFNNYMKARSRFALWTTFKVNKNFIKGDGYAKGFLSSNARATNEYRHKKYVAYLINKYLNPNIKQFFTANRVKVDQDAYALSEMLQFIWRSAIRDGKEIWVYVPSSRMRKLFQDWINSFRALNSHSDNREI